MNRDSAEDIAIAGLSYIAQDDALLPRFLALTGLEVAQIREAAAQPGFFAGVLQFILAHEPTLLAFCTASEITPSQVMAAHRSLPFGNEDWDIQT